MKNVLIFSGTTEGRELAEALCARQIDCVASVATEYGREVMRPQEHLVIREGRMSEPEMEELMRTGAFLAVVDATHPYAVEVTEHIKESAKKTNLPYLRLSRSTAAEREIAEHEWMIHTVADTQECVKLLSSLPGNILLTTGSKELHAYAVREEIRKRLFVRVLPGVESIEICHREQIPGKQIIAMQGPFGTELNEALIRQYDIGVLVTKESGQEDPRGRAHKNSCCYDSESGTGGRDEHGKSPVRNRNTLREKERDEASAAADFSRGNRSGEHKVVHRRGKGGDCAGGGGLRSEAAACRG